MARRNSPRSRFPEGIRLLVLDFDGVMTDNRVWVDQDGRESVVVNRADGLGLAMLARAGVEALVLSTEENPVVGARCRKLRLGFAQGVRDKREVLSGWMRERSLKPEEVVFVGNDVNDRECLELAGLGVAVADAVPEILETADWVLTRKGGCGAVREICDLILRSQNSKPQTRALHAANNQDR